MAHACFSIISEAKRNAPVDRAGYEFKGGETPGLFFRDEVDSQKDHRAVKAMVEFSEALVYPLCRIATKLGVASIPANEELQPGIWISDGTGNGVAFNYIELIDKMTERMSK